MLNDRRKFPRVPVFLMVERVNRAGDSGGEEGSGVIKNLTPAGILLETDLPVKQNDLLQLSFTLPRTSTTLNLEARVRWCDPKRSFTSAGLEFMDVSAEERDAIMEYLMGLGPTV
jgi:hypothetical protein